jgi:hypothetical protein
MCPVLLVQEFCSVYICVVMLFAWRWPLVAETCSETEDCLILLFVVLWLVNKMVDGSAV